MKTMNKILTAILICMPMVAWGANDVNKDELKTKLDKEIESMSSAPDKKELNGLAGDAFLTLEGLYCYDSNNRQMSKFRECKGIIDEFRNMISWGGDDDSQNSDNNSADDDNAKKKAEAQQKLEEAQAKLDKAKETEQSFANRMLGGLTTAATGIGGMQLAQGIAEKSADSAADKDMDAYMATIKCTYGDGKSVPFSVEPVELPGGNNADLMKYRAEYVALAADLKERKTALGMTPGIESEEIIDKATAGLYDDENTGITGGAYASRYRAAAGNEKDQKGLNADKKEAKTRMIAGGVVAGVGVVGGIVGNSLINGKLGELIKESRANKQKSKDHDATVKAIKQALKDKGYTNVNDLDFSNVDVGALKDADWSQMKEATSSTKNAKSSVCTENKTCFVSSLKGLGVKGSDDE